MRLISKDVDLEFFAAINHRALREDENVEAAGEGAGAIDRGGIGYVYLLIVEAGEVRPFFAGIVGCGGTGSPDPHLRALCAEKLSDAVADAAGAADHECALALQCKYVRADRHFVISLSVGQDAFVGSGPAMSGRSERYGIRVS